MRLRPEEEMSLVAGRATLRLLCNWVWPLMVLAYVMWIGIAYLGRGSYEWWMAPFDIGWLVMVSLFWRGDVRKLRAVRAKLAEAHDEA